MNDPIVRFRNWLGRAAAADRISVPEPTAFALATVSGAGRPSVRMLLLKGVEDGNFVFYTNLTSRKGRELAETGFAALCFHWAALELQVRVEGTVTAVSESDADAYFASRPRESQIGAWASLQSAPIEHEGDLEARVAEMTERFRDADVPRPPHWSGFRLRPDAIEFWEGRPARLHRREVYNRSGDTWHVRILYP